MLLPPRIQRRRVRITGQVQGVGFRPYVYRLATQLRLTGFVINDARGVTVEVQGGVDAVREFERRLPQELPPLAAIHSLEAEDAHPMRVEGHFEIQPSRSDQLIDAQVTVDTAVCGDCLRELNDPADPRYRYPFINCTNCGPRYTIIRSIPYDRPNTTMADFAMCPLCAGQYGDPGDRRFHAQPVACPQCGPAVWLVDPHGRQIACDDAIAEAAGMLEDGRVVAVKGLGGFHLACRADDQHAVGRLRRRKRRDAKPFALMVADLDAARRLCHVSDAAAVLLAEPTCPIVVMPRRGDAGRAPVAAGVADGIDTLALMLPYTPLHHLLFRSVHRPLVMTSGNYSEEPLVKDNDAAISHLGRIADALLLHNRRIERRLDDSVVRMHRDETWTVLRRGRGFAPQPVHLPGLADGGPGGGGSGGPAVLAVGAELKNAVCLFRDGRAVLSEHIGDLTDGRTYRHFIETISHLSALFEFSPELLAADLHPQYMATEYALRWHRGELPGRAALPVVRVQHHHAHVASCLAEHGRTAPVIGLACDGVGYGDDGAVWGCEVLRADLLGYERLGHLRYLSLAGGDAAAKETWRPALSALHDALGEQTARRVATARLPASPQQIDAALEMIALGVQCPASSSLGRWFDAAAALCGVAGVNRYEGEAPMKLEAVVADGEDGVYPFRILSSGPFLIDLAPMVERLVADLTAGVAAGRVSARFHNTVAAFLSASAARAREETHLEAVALSGGCFANRYLTARLAAALEADGFEVLRHHRIPCNDGGVALGQAAVAEARRRAKTEAAKAAPRRRSSG